MAYATPSDWITRTDVRRLGDLANDTGVRATPTQLLTHARILAVLDDAAGLIDSAIMAGGRYSPADLAALGTNSLALLVRLNCDLAYGMLLEAREYTQAEAASMSPGYARGLMLLTKLREGEWIFVTDGAIEAGLPTTAELSADIQLITDKAHRYFGVL